MYQNDDKPVGYVGKEGKTSAPWWRSEKASRKMLSDAFKYGDYDVEVYELVTFFNDLASQLRVKKSGRFYQQFVSAAKELGLFDMDLNLLVDELPIAKYRKLHWILEDYLTMIDAHAGDHRGDQVSNTTGIPPQWFIEDELNIVLNPVHWFKRGLATIITGENGAGKTNMMAWIMLQLAQKENANGLRPVIATNLKFYDEYVRDYGIQRVRTISDIFDVVAKIDLMGERRNLYCFIDEFDGAEGQNAWENRGKEAGSAFRVFNQMRKTQEIIMVPAIHFPQDVNNRWRDSLQGVHCIMNKGKYYPPQGQKDHWDCIRYHDDLEVLKSVAIFWKGMPINLQCIPDVSYSFETYANTYFTFDYTPRDVVQLMEVIDRIPLPEHGHEDERIEWLIRRGTAISTFNKEWREQQTLKEKTEDSKKQQKTFREHWIAEAHDLHFNQQMTYPGILKMLRSKFKGHKYYSSLPKNTKALTKAVNRWVEEGGEADEEVET
jgi:hypothetical protein